MKHPKNVWTEPEYETYELGALVTEYLRWVVGRAEAVSRGTVDKYRKSLLSFCKSIHAAGEPLVLASVTPTAGDRWVAEQREKKLAPEGIASRQAAVKVFTNKYVYAELQMTHRDLLARWKRIKAEAEGKEGLSDAQVDYLKHDLFGNGHNDVRDRALVLVFISTGLRFREVLGMTVDGFDRISGEFKVVAKGGKQRTVRMSPDALKAVKKWLRERERTADEGETALWTTDEGGPVSYWGGQSIFRRLKGKASMPNLHAHLLRHTFGQGAIRKDAPRALVQDMLGHSTDAMTRRYVKREADLKAAEKMPQFSLV